MSVTAADFNCAICLDVAEEPVVTRCGHLFCWSCLDQWLHRPDAVPDCPMCKGRVDESIPGDIIPIYGKGAKSKNNTRSNTTIQSNTSAVYASTSLSSSSSHLSQEDATVETVIEGNNNNNNNNNNNSNATTSSAARTIFQEYANAQNVERNQSSASNSSEAFSHLHRSTSYATSHAPSGETPATSESHSSSNSGNTSSGRNERSAEHPRPSAARAPTPPRPAHRFNIRGYGMPLQFGSFFFIFGGGMGSGVMMLMIALWAMCQFVPWREWLHSARNYLPGRHTPNTNTNPEPQRSTTHFAHHDDNNAHANSRYNNSHNDNYRNRGEDDITRLFGARPANAQMPQNALQESENTARLMLIALVVIFVLYGFLWTM